METIFCFRLFSPNLINNLVLNFFFIFNKGDSTESLWWQYKRDDDGQYYAPKDGPLNVQKPKILDTDLDLYNRLFQSNEATLNNK